MSVTVSSAICKQFPSSDMDKLVISILNGTTPADSIVKDITVSSINDTISSNAINELVSQFILSAVNNENCIEFIQQKIIVPSITDIVENASISAFTTSFNREYLRIALEVKDNENGLRDATKIFTASLTSNTVLTDAIEKEITSIFNNFAKYALKKLELNNLEKHLTTAMNSQEYNKAIRSVVEKAFLTAIRSEECTKLITEILTGGYISAIETGYGEAEGVTSEDQTELELDLEFSAVTKVENLRRDIVKALNDLAKQARVNKDVYLFTFKSNTNLNDTCIYPQMIKIIKDKISNIGSAIIEMVMRAESFKGLLNEILKKAVTKDIVKNTVYRSFEGVFIHSVAVDSNVRSILSSKLNSVLNKSINTYVNKVIDYVTKCVCSCSDTVSNVTTIIRNLSNNGIIDTVEKNINFSLRIRDILNDHDLGTIYVDGLMEINKRVLTSLCRTVNVDKLIKDGVL